MKVYHYTKSSTWRKIQKNKEKLEPRKAHENFPEGIFCLPDSPFPENWAHNPEVPQAMSFLLGCIGNKDHGPTVALEFETNPEDKVYVADCIYYGAYAVIAGRKTNELDYVNSVIPLEEDGGNYILPEIIVCNPVGCDRVKVVDSFDNVFSYLASNKALHEWFTGRLL